MITFNPNGNLVSTTDGGSGAGSWPSPLLTITGCTAANTLFALIGIDPGNVAGTSAPSAPSGWTLDSSHVTVAGASFPIGFALYRKASASAGSNAFALGAYGSATYYYGACLFETTPLTLDKAPAGASAAAATLTGPNTGTLSAAVEFALGICAANQSGIVTIPGVPTGFTSIYGNDDSIAVRAVYQMTSATTAINPAWSSSGSDIMVAGVTTYTDASGTTPPPAAGALSLAGQAPARVVGTVLTPGTAKVRDALRSIFLPPWRHGLVYG